MDTDQILINADELIKEFPILQKLGMIPAVLLTQAFERNSKEAAIANAPWDIVFFISDGKREFYENFQTSTREPLDKTIDDQEIIPSKKNLPVVDLGSEKGDDEAFLEDIVGPALRHLISRVLNKNGVIFFNNIPEKYYEQLYQTINDYKLK